MNVLCFLGVFCLSCFLCWLLSLAYPQGLVNEETSSYWMLQESFQWFAQNHWDWYRTVPYALLLSWGARFGNPTNAIFWQNALIFSFNMALVFGLGVSLFKSCRLALSLAIGAIVFEVACMRIFYMNLQVAPDGVYSELLYAGVLLALIGWFEQNRWLFLAGYALFGWTAFMKPAGVIFWPVGLIVAVMAWQNGQQKRWQKYALIAASIVLMVGPVCLWCARNYFVWGYLKSSGVGWCSLLQGVLPIMSAQDKLFDNPEVNADFITAVKQTESFCNMSSFDKSSALERRDMYEKYYLYGPGPNNPFVFLLKMTDPGWHGTTGFHNIAEFNTRQMFKLDAIASSVALKIILGHPVLYAKRVLREYIDMFRPEAMPSNPHYT